MTIDLYYTSASSPCQSIMMLADTLGVELNLKEIDLHKGAQRTPEFVKPTSCPCQSVMMLANTLGVELNLKTTIIKNGENRTPEYLKMNPQHCIPTLNDNGFVLWESRAILCYLVDQYGKDDFLYPKDPKKRAVVNQRLYFDIGTLYPKFIQFYMPILYGGKGPDPAHVAAFGEPIELLEKILEGKEWVAGDHITIADYAIVATISVMQASGYDLTKHPNVSRWFYNTKKAINSCEDIITRGVTLWLERIKNITTKQ